MTSINPRSTKLINREDVNEMIENAISTKTGVQLQFKQFLVGSFWGIFIMFVSYGSIYKNTNQTKLILKELIILCIE